jgi:hypothetical protein
MQDLMDVVTSLDRNEDVHLARILVLLRAFREADRPAIEGITKLAKLDFLLRYPSCLQTALRARGVRDEVIPVDDFEALTIEARMVRYRYGPWDHRYRRFLNTLAAKGLVSVSLEGQTINIDLVDAGARLADELVASPAYGRVYARAKLLKKHLDLKARALMEFVYETFPELTSLEYNEGIEFRSELPWK